MLLKADPDANDQGQKQKRDGRQEQQMPLPEGAGRRRTIRPQPLQMVQREGIGPPQAGQRKTSAAAGLRAARLCRSAAWTS